MDDRFVTAGMWRAATRLLSGVLILAVLAGCSNSASNSVVVQGATPVVFAKRAATALGDPTDSVTFAPGGDLMMLDLASPSAQMVNLTAAYTLGQGDVCDPEVSYDGTRVLFSMRGPSDVTYHIFEMDLGSGVMHRIIPDDATANLGDDVGPAYLPDGRIVFSSNRQVSTKALLTAQNTDAYTYLDEYERQQSTVLHVMNADGSDIHQISFNQSHDRNPTVLLSGQVMFARWEHVGARNHFPIFFANPDGTDIFVRYGAFSPGNSFIQPREMPNGQVMTTLMPLDRTHMGGALMGIDVQDFSDNDQPASPIITGVGQTQLTLNQIDFNETLGLAPYGRYTTPYPLWDGTNRALVSWSPSRPTTTVDPTSGMTVPTEGAPLYGIYMFSLDNQTLVPIAIPPDGWEYVDAIAVASRPVPNTIPDLVLDQSLASQGLGLLNIKSVYDTDVLDIMGLSELVPGETIPQTTPPPGDVRSSVADIAKIKDPKQTTAAQRPARFLKVMKAVPTPSGVSMQTFGNTEFEMQNLVGYTDIEPDGSARIQVPADTPLALSVVDSNGMAIQVHTNWIQVRPGETRTCDGCHSPRRGTALNVTPIAGNDPNTLLVPEPGESMAETRTRLDPSHMTLVSDPTYVDVWTDPTAAGRPPDPPLSITYAGLTTPAPLNGVINYPDNIAPIFTAVRATGTCTNCHNNNVTTDPNSVGVDLTSPPAGTGRDESYEALTLGPVVFNPTTGLPTVTIDDDDNVMILRGDPLVRTGNSDDGSRHSRFFEEMLDKQLLSGTPLPTQTVNHAGMLDASELRLLAEWVDGGGQYYNDPFTDPPGTHQSINDLRGVMGLSQTTFNSSVHPILLNRCASCHKPYSNNGTTGQPVNAAFQANQFILTGDPMGDYNNTLTMVTNVCTPSQNPLLLRPTSTGGGTYPHPQIGSPAGPVLLTTDADYNTILSWIASGTCSG
jgi:hypothetical protein